MKRLAHAVLTLSNAAARLLAAVATCAMIAENGFVEWLSGTWNEGGFGALEAWLAFCRNLIYIVT